MRQMRFDNPSTNPAIRFDGELPPRRGRRVTVSNDPRPAAKQKADSPRPTALTTPTQPKRRDPIRDAQDRTAARRDAALAAVRDQHKTARRGYSRADMRQGPSKAKAAEAIRAQSKGVKA